MALKCVNYAGRAYPSALLIRAKKELETAFVPST